MSDVKNPDKPTIHNGIPHVRENYFNVSKNDYWNGNNGYHIEDKTDLEKFTQQITSDFQLLVLPKFNFLTNENAILSFYSDEFWGPRVKQSLKIGYKNTRIDD